MEKILLHIGCGNKRYGGFINSDKDEMDISKVWDYDDNSVDGIISMQVFQQIYWRDLLIALNEAYRVLKPKGVMRFGTMLVDDNDAEYALGWKNINLFSFDLLKKVLRQVGFKNIRIAKYRDSKIKEFRQVDDRHIGKGTTYVEVEK